MLKTMAPLLALLACSATFAEEAHAQDQNGGSWLDIEVGKSVTVTTPKLPTAIAVTNPNIAVTQTLGAANKIQVQGVNIGTTDLVVQFGPGIPPLIYEVTVHRDLSDLIRRIDSIVEGEPPRVYPLGERIVVEGAVDDLDTLEQVALVSRIYDVDFVNLMSVRGDHQVQLEVMFAEVSRTATRQLGLNVLYGDQSLGLGMIQSSAGAPFWAAPGLSNLIQQQIQGGGQSGGLVATPIPNSITLGGYAQAIDLTAVIGMMDQYQLGKILAQPTLISLSGQQSEFLAGGEVPIPVPQGGGGGQTQVTIEYKEYGVNLAFVPTVLANNVIDIRMYLEISEPDYSVATSIAGISVPGFVTRKGSNHIRLESGKTFAVAGLLSDNVNYARTGVPGLGRIPLIGTLFRTVRHVREETEVVIYVTPRLVRPLSPGEVPAAPGTTENNNPSDFELFLLGMDHRPSSRTVSPTGAVGLQR